MYMNHMYKYFELWSSKEDFGSPGAAVIDDCELPSGYGDLKPGPLQEWQVLLTTEPALHSLMYLFLS